MRRSAQFRFMGLLLGLLLLLPLAGQPRESHPADSSFLRAITWVDIPVSKAFPDAIAKGTLRYACASNEEFLASFFREQSLDFDERLIQQRKGLPCHIYYEPTVRGYRAHTESDPVQGLVFTMDWRGFQGQRSLQIGDSLDVAKTILTNVRRPLAVSVRSTEALSSEWRRKAIDFHFPDTIHSIQLRDNPAERENVWAQDYIKSGHVGGETTVLITRKAYEGKNSNGPLFDPLIRSFEARGWVRSKLSWDGGDIQFGQNPKHPGRIIIFYGDAARMYWGKTLSTPEYEYVLRTEFGADDAVDLGGLVAHVDYFLATLPDAKTALVSRRIRQNMDLSRMAIRLLQLRFGDVPLLKELEEIYAGRDRIEGPAKDRVLELLRKMHVESPDWSPRVNMSAYNQISAYWDANCGNEVADCTTPSGFERMLGKDPQMLRDWLGMASVVRMGTMLPDAMLSVIYSQAVETGQRRTKLVDAKIHELRDLGYHVIEVPQIHGDVEAGIPWSGISYVNAAIVDSTIFMPSFGLGEPEKAIFAQVQAQLPPPYRVVPVLAQEVLLANGGTHCVVGFLRTTDPLRISRNAAPDSSAPPVSTASRENGVLGNSTPAGTTSRRD